MTDKIQLKPMRVGRLLNLLRQARGKSLKTMVDEFQEGGYYITTTTLHYYESGRRFPSIESGPDLLRTLHSQLTQNLGDESLVNSDLPDMNEYLQNMLGKEALYRAMNECIDLRYIGHKLLVAYLSGPLPKFNRETGSILAQDILTNWYTNNNITYRQNMALWLLQDYSFVNQNKIEINPDTGEVDMALESFKNVRSFLQCPDALTPENIGPAIDALFVFGDHIELSTSSTSDFEISFLNAAGQSQKFSYSAQASGLQKSSKNIRK